MKLQEIEAACSNFKVCRKCNSREGFWFGMKRDQCYLQCKSCGSRFEFHEVYIAEEKGKPQKFRFTIR